MEAAVSRKAQIPVFTGFSGIFFRKGEELHYIGGADVLPAPLDAKEEAIPFARLCFGRGKNV